MTQSSPQDVSGTQQVQKSRLLLVGEEDEFSGGTSERTTTLLGALARLGLETIDVVLLSHSFRDEELALFTADARRNGFRGHILRVASLNKQLSTQSSSNHPSETISFSDRQRAVLKHVCQGWSNRQIAQTLKCSETSVKAVIQDLFRKLKVRKRAQIVRVTLEKQLISVQEPQTTERPEFLTNLKDQPPIDVGDFIIDVAMHQVWIRGAEIHLTPNEFQLLCILALQPGKLVHGSTLRHMLWSNPTSRVESLRVLVGSLRAKIEQSKIPRYVITERSLGYRFNPSP